MRNIGIKLAIILLIWASGCKSKPKDLIPQDDMVQIIADIKLLETKVDHFYLRNMDSSRVAFRILQQDIFKKYETDSTHYNQSYSFYLQDKKKMVDILNKVEALLDEKQNEILGKPLENVQDPKKETNKNDFPTLPDTPV